MVYHSRSIKRLYMCVLYRPHLSQTHSSFTVWLLRYFTSCSTSFIYSILFCSLLPNSHPVCPFPSLYLYIIKESNYKDEFACKHFPFASAHTHSETRIKFQKMSDHADNDRILCSFFPFIHKSGEGRDVSVSVSVSVSIEAMYCFLLPAWETNEKRKQQHPIKTKHTWELFRVRAAIDVMCDVKIQIEFLKNVLLSKQ